MFHCSYNYFSLFLLFLFSPLCSLLFLFSCLFLSPLFFITLSSFFFLSLFLPLLLFLSDFHSLKENNMFVGLSIYLYQLYRYPARKSFLFYTKARYPSLLGGTTSLPNNWGGNKLDRRLYELQKKTGERCLSFESQYHRLILSMFISNILQYMFLLILTLLMYVYSLELLIKGWKSCLL